ncbi:DUF1059 domain-containing protein [Actinomycetospora sp.]|uniref:DUF1059 domain-containing protein n=1 Tax=Actinomycetospora sp. TaxID=1872135 RepID=UPI002F41F848
MTRKTIDCRDMPSDVGCTVVISGEEDEVLRLAAAHAVDVHGHRDDDELRAGLRAGMRDAAEAPSRPGAFVQLIEFRTHRIADFEATEDQWADAIGDARTARWALTAADRDRPDTYLQVVEFPDHPAAMSNSTHPATAEFADRLAKLCEGEATFHNLDVHRSTTWA